MNIRNLPITRKDDEIYIPLPKELWVKMGPCDCSFCRGQIAYMDTLVVPVNPPKKPEADATWLSHWPDLQR